MRMFENRVLRRIFDGRVEESTATRPKIPEDAILQKETRFGKTKKWKI
jgi:hypothetical protein